MGYLWGTYGVPMGYLWGYLWGTYGVTLGTYGAPLGFFTGVKYLGKISTMKPLRSLV